MKILKIILVLLMATMLHAMCKKNNNIAKKSGYYFASTLSKSWLLQFPFSGIFLQNQNLSFFHSNARFNFAPDEIITCQTDQQIMHSKAFRNKDTSILILELFAINNGKYLARIKDLKIDTEITGIKYYLEKFALMDANGTISNAFIIPTFNERISGFRPLSNGNYIVNCNYREGGALGNTIYCFDENMNLKWQSKLPGPQGFSATNIIADLLCKDNYIYILGTYTSASNDYTRILKYDFLGKEIKSFPASAPGQLGLRLLPATNGFMVFAASYTGATQNRLMLANFDVDCNLLSTNYISPKDVASSSESAPLENFLEGYTLNEIISNIIYKDKKYYFTLTVFDKSGNKNNISNKFLRVNEAFEIEEIKVLETTALNFQSFKYLVPKGDHFISIASTNWNNTYGISFIETDADGNIIH